MPAMSADDKPFTTKYPLHEGTNYIFLSLDRELTGQECHKLAVQYFEEHRNMTLPAEALIVDVRPAFRKPLADVTPQLHAAPE
jgi:hypothetical protein